MTHRSAPALRPVGIVAGLLFGPVAVCVALVLFSRRYLAGAMAGAFMQGIALAVVLASTATVEDGALRLGGGTYALLPLLGLGVALVTGLTVGATFFTDPRDDPPAAPSPGTPPPPRRDEAPLVADVWWEEPAPRPHDGPELPTQIRASAPPEPRL